MSSVPLPEPPTKRSRLPVDHCEPLPETVTRPAEPVSQPTWLSPLVTAPPSLMSSVPLPVLPTQSREFPKLQEGAVGVLGETSPVLDTDACAHTACGAPSRASAATAAAAKAKAVGLRPAPIGGHAKPAPVRWHDPPQTGLAVVLAVPGEVPTVAAEALPAVRAVSGAATQDPKAQFQRVR